MQIRKIDSTSFGILDRSSIKKRPYGEYYSGNYKGSKIEVFNAYKFKHRLVYASDKDLNFIRLKLIEFVDGVRKVFKSRRAR